MKTFLLPPTVQCRLLITVGALPASAELVAAHKCVSDLVERWTGIRAMSCRKVVHILEFTARSDQVGSCVWASVKR